MFQAKLHLSRRMFLAGGATFTAAALIPALGHASGARDPRFLTVILRGALDGLATVVPVGDPEWGKLRRETLLSADGPDPTLPLDSFFGLNPRLPNFHRLYQKGEASVVHAVSTPYRGRSHFDGQDLLESGLPDVGRADDGWLNRAATAMAAEQRVAVQGLSVGPVVPLIMRGEAPVLTWGLRDLQDVSSDTLARLMALYSDKDPALLAALNGMIDSRREMGGEDSGEVWRESKGLERQFGMAADGAGSLMARSDGPRVGALAFDGWDTHANERPVDGRLGNLLGALDIAFATFEEVMKPVWKDTAIMVVTEFGRTVAENGTDGTDHGTGTVALLLGGAIKGGKVLADWPGLGASALLDNRDLRPTTDLRAVAKGLMAEHLGLDRSILDDQVFPDSRDAAMIAGLVRGA